MRHFNSNALQMISGQLLRFPCIDPWRAVGGDLITANLICATLRKCTAWSWLAQSAYKICQCTYRRGSQERRTDDGVYKQRRNEVGKRGSKWIIIVQGDEDLLAIHIVDWNTDDRYNIPTTLRIRWEVGMAIKRANECPEWHLSIQYKCSAE